MPEEQEIFFEDTLGRPRDIIAPGLYLRDGNGPDRRLSCSPSWDAVFLDGRASPWGFGPAAAVLLLCARSSSPKAWASGASRVPVMWGFAITNFVWWIGIGHAGTLISAILLLLNQRWRNSINRFAEAMTLFAVACAGMFPMLHLGRPWLVYWLFPYPNTMGVSPIPQSAGVGRLRGFHLRHRIAAVLVRRLMPDLATCETARITASRASPTA